VSRAGCPDPRSDVTFDRKEDNSDETNESGSRIIGVDFGFEGRSEDGFGRRDLKLKEAVL